MSQHESSAVETQTNTNSLEAVQFSDLGIVVSGLGYPNGRADISPEPTGWHPMDNEKVSRETFN